MLKLFITFLYAINMRRKILLSIITLFNFCFKCQITRYSCVGFFGLDNGLPSLLCNQLGSLLDGMPVNFKFPLDASTLSGN